MHISRETNVIPFPASFRPRTPRDPNPPAARSPWRFSPRDAVYWIDAGEIRPAVIVARIHSSPGAYLVEEPGGWQGYIGDHRLHPAADGGRAA